MEKSANNPTEMHFEMQGQCLTAKLARSQDPRSYSLYCDLNIWFRAQNLPGLSRNGPQGQKISRSLLTGGKINIWGGEECVSLY